jgi:hypothetical protein
MASFLSVWYRYLDCPFCKTLETRSGEVGAFTAVWDECGGSDDSPWDGTQ